MMVDGTPPPPAVWEEEAPTEPHVTVPEADRTYVEKPALSPIFAPLGVDLERILLISDLHAPFHDKKAWDALLNFAASKGCHTIVDMGDFSDFYCVSAHDKDPRRAKNLVEESEASNTCLDDVDRLGAKRKIFCKGNHEYRLDRYLMGQGGALLGAVTTDTLLRLTERGWSVFDYGHHVRVGNLYVTHDVGRSGQNAVFQAANVVGHNIATGHTHRLTQAYFGTMLGERYVSATLGWLGDPDSASYVCSAVRSTWQHGFGYVEMERSGDFDLRLVPIVNGRILAR
jgi:predicted phosphodiesterase